MAFFSNIPLTCDGRTMKGTLFVVLTLFAGAFILGCQSNKPINNTSSGLSPLYEGESVRVYVGGRDKGVTPMTLHVSRTRGEYDVKLRRGREVVRQYEIALENSYNASPERQAIFMDLENDNGVMGIKTFGLDDLESQNDTLYYVPYYDANLSIDDAKYGLTLVVTN